MVDPIDETLDALNRHVGRTGQIITTEFARAMQRAGEKRARQARDAQNRADREKE